MAPRELGRQLIVRKTAISNLKYAYHASVRGAHVQAIGGPREVKITIRRLGLFVVAKQRRAQQFRPGLESIECCRLSDEAYS